MRHSEHKLIFQLGFLIVLGALVAAAYDNNDENRALHAMIMIHWDINYDSLQQKAAFRR